MKITKFGHCALLVEADGLRILTDPGNMSSGQNETERVDIILITHEHGDHYHVPSLRAILAKNPGMKVITNRGVGKLLDGEKIAYSLVEHGQFEKIKGVLIEGMGEQHAPIYSGVPEVVNTGYFINKSLWYPGDAFFDPGRRPKILALPIGGPWVKLSEALDYAKLLKPDVAFPVHDGMFKNGGFAHKWPGMFLPPAKIEWKPLWENESVEF